MTKFLSIGGGLSLPVYVLNDPNDQAAGFQNFKEIPDTYGLWFPNMNGRGFHMRNVGGRLLACGLRDLGKGHYQIMSSEMWLPNGACPYSGDNVLECHPGYASDFTLGKVVVLSDLGEKDKRLE